MKKFLKVLVKILLIVVLLILTAGTVMYIEGYYDFTFIDRDKVMSVLPGYTAAETSEPDLYSDDYTSPKAPGDNISLFTHPEAVDVVSSEDVGETKFVLPDADEAYDAGWILTDTEFDRTTHIIAEVALKSAPIGRLNGRSSRKTMVPYMGWIMYDDGDSLSLADSMGNVRLTAFDGAEPVWFRDTYSRPLFRYKDELYFVSESSSGVRMYKSDFDESWAPVLRLNAASDYGAPKAGLYRYHTDITDPATGTVRRLWGYADADKNVVIEAQYVYAANFGEEGLACVAGDDMLLKVIDTAGNVVIEENGVADRAGVRSDVNCYFVWPDTVGEEQLGQIYYDSGYLRVTEKYVEKRTGADAGSRELLINTQGNVHDYPQGYNLAYYSSGILILESDGKYGMIDLYGNWIAQPIYTYVTPFCEGLAVIGFEDGKKCMIDTSGNIILPFEYTWISECSGGVITAFDGTWHVMNKLARVAE